MKYKAAIFDMDGTILNTLEDLFCSVNYSLKENNLPLRTKEEIRNFTGSGISVLIKRSVPQESSEEIFDKVLNDFKTYYAEHCADFTKPYSGIIELIENLRKAGMKTAVVSNKIDSAVQNLTKKYFNNLFDAAAGEREGIKMKPHPDSVQYIMNTLNVNHKEVIYIGDSGIDFKTALNSNIEFIGVTWGFCTKDFLSANGAKTIADDTKTLEKLILN